MGINTVPRLHHSSWLLQWNPKHNTAHTKYFKLVWLRRFCLSNQGIQSGGVCHRGSKWNRTREASAITTEERGFVQSFQVEYENLHVSADSSFIIYKIYQLTNNLTYQLNN